MSNRSVFAVWRWPYGKGRSWRMSVLAVVALAGAATAYQAAYIACLTTPAQMALVTPDGKAVLIVTRPYYAFERRLTSFWSDAATSALRPAHRIDRYFRPAVWPEPRVAAFARTAGESQSDPASEQRQ